MPSCSVKWCSNHTSTCSLKSKNGVSFHRFPKDEEICQKWVEAVRHERRDPWWTSTNASRVCSMHFKETDISSTPCKVNILAKTAVPICTMVWYDEDENNTSTKTSNEGKKTDKPILKTYERKKTNVNVLKELKVNMSDNGNKEGTGMSKTDSVVRSNTILSLYQDNLPQATKLLKTLEVSTPLNSKEFQVSNSIANINSKTSATANVTKPQKNTVFESNKREYDKYCQEKCCKSKILVKLNDNTSLIIDEDWSNDNTIFRDSNIISKEPNSRKCEYLRNVTFKEFKSIKNKNPNKVTNISNSDMFLKTITNGNVELNTNITKSYVGKMLRTYLPKRKDKISEKNIKDTSEQLKKNKSLNTVKWKKVNNLNINKHSKGDFSNKLKINVYYKNNIIASNTNRKKNQRSLLNVKKSTFKRKSNLFNGPRIREQKKNAVEPNIDVNKESNIAHIDEFITNQSIDNIKETAVYDEMISELFETSKNVGNISPNDNYQVSNENVCTDNNIDTALDKETNKRNVILDLDTNIYTELNTFTDQKLCRMVNTGLNGEIREEEEKTEVNTNKKTINEKITQFNENTMSELEPESNENNISDINEESKKIVGKDMPDLDVMMNMESCREVNIGLNSSINTELNTNKTDNADFPHYNENTAKESNQKLPRINKNMTAEQSDNLIPISIQCNKNLEKDLPESNPVILSELNEDQVIKSKEVMNRKLNRLNTEMYTDKELLLQKSRRDFVLVTSDDQHKVVNEHMDVVDSILNRDIAAEFDLSLLSSGTPVPDEEIPNLDKNSDNNSLDGIVGSPNWIQLPTGEIPKILDDILDRGSPFFGNLDLHDKYNKFNIDKESNGKDNEIKNLTKEKYSTSNLEQLKEKNIHNDCDNSIQWTNNSIAQIEKQLITTDTETVRELNIGQLKKAIFEECYDPECGNDCKNQNHNLNSESKKKDDELYEKQTIYTPCQPDIEKRKGRYDLSYKRQCYQASTDNSKKQLKNSFFDPNTEVMKEKSFLERHELSRNEKYKTKYKKIAIDHIPGQYLELRWKEDEEKSDTLSQEGCKRKHKELGLDHRKMLCSESTNIFSQQIMAECPECGYTTDDNDLMNYKSDVDLTITKPLSLINKDTLISSDIENENNQNNGNNNRAALESVYAMELAYVTAIQALERKLKQKIAISEYRLRKVNNLSKINNQLSFANIALMDLFRRNKI